MSSPAITPQGSSPVLFPDGEVHMIPPDNMAEATNPKNGGEVAHKLIFPGEDKPRWVPHSQLSPALQAGGKPADPQALFNIAATQRTPSGVVVSPDAGTMTNQPPSGVTHPINWMREAISDMETGGSKTMLGRILGYAQGRGDKGFQGVNAGPNAYVNGKPAQGQTGDFIASPVLGPAHVLSGMMRQAYGMATANQDETRGGGMEAASGALQAATIPSAFMAPEAAEAASQLTPGAMAARAGQKFEQVARAVGPGAVVDAQPALAAATRGEQLATRGANSAKPLANFLQQIGDRSSMPWQEARDFYSTSGNPSVMERLSASRPVQAQVAQFREGLGSALNEAASNANMGDVYQSALKQYRTAMQLQKAGKWAGALAAFEIADQMLGGRVTRMIRSGVQTLP